MSLGRVLVVDDESDIRKSVRLILTQAGYDIVEAEDGEKAVAVIKSADNANEIDTIICDIYMPKMNGLEAIAHFRSQFPSIPVIVLTGQTDMHWATALFKQGVADYLVKPVDPGNLTAAVQKTTRERILLKGPFTK
jgi:two-component system chemotaxis response regulator CheY